jgi:hypothetical protein
MLLCQTDSNRFYGCQSTRFIQYVISIRCWSIQGLHTYSLFSGLRWFKIRLFGLLRSFQGLRNTKA